MLLLLLLFLVLKKASFYVISNIFFRGAGGKRQGQRQGEVFFNRGTTVCFDVPQILTTNVM